MRAPLGFISETRRLCHTGEHPAVEFSYMPGHSGCNERLRKLAGPIGKPERSGTRFFKPLRQVIESINNTPQGPLGIEGHGGRTPAGVVARVRHYLQAMTAAIWYNDTTGAKIKRSLTAYNH